MPLMQKLRRLAGEQALGRIHHIVGSKTVVKPSRRLGMAGGGHALGHSGGEGDHIVLDLALDLVDPGDLEAGVLAQQPGGLRRDLPHFGEHFGSRQLDL